MTDEIERRLRQGLSAQGSNWAPGRPPEATRWELAGRIRRRRRHQAVAAAGAVGALAVVSTMIHASDSGAAPGRDQADPTVVVSTPSSPPPSGPGPTTTLARPTAPAGPVAHGVSLAPRPSPGASRTGGAGFSPSPTGPTPSGGRPRSGGSGTTEPPPTVPGTTVLPTTTTTEPATSVPPVTTVPTTTGAGTYVFTDADSGTRVDVTTGATLVLRLTSCPGTTWGAAVSSRPHVVEPRSFAGLASLGSASAVLVAEQAGTAVLHLLPQSTCASPTPPFTLTVVVD